LPVLALRIRQKQIKARKNDRAGERASGTRLEGFLQGMNGGVGIFPIQSATVIVKT
jgi:hypothetical protein